MNRPTKCPHCKTSLLGEPISQDYIDKGYYHKGSYWKREIGIDGGYMGIYDGIVAFQCPDCNKEFPRENSKWGKMLFERYKKYLKNEKM